MILVVNMLVISSWRYLWPSTLLNVYVFGMINDASISSKTGFLYTKSAPLSIKFVIVCTSSIEKLVTKAPRATNVRAS
jgi:hypothetical protein